MALTTLLAKGKKMSIYEAWALGEDHPKQEPRVLVWFSCGAASAVAAKLAITHYRRVEVIYCDTFAYEHPDNKRFIKDVERWLGYKIKILKSKEYKDIFDVFDKTGWLVGPGGARCTIELKKRLRMDYERPGDIQIFGFTAEEKGRIKKFNNNNPDIRKDHILDRFGFTKKMCFERLEQDGIELPVMYRLGYKNNNCIGCVKGQAGYWNKIRRDFPEAFERMAQQERKMNVAINKRYVGGKRVRVFLDELPKNAGNYKSEAGFECGVLCQAGQ